MSFLVEQAGGMATTGKNRIMVRRIFSRILKSL